MKDLPPDRSYVHTERRHPDSMRLDTLDSAGCVNLMIDDHQAVLNAMRSAQPALSAFIDALVPRLKAGGRLIYLGAGTSGRLGVLDAAECPPTFQSDPKQVVGVIAGGDSSLRQSSESREDEWDGACESLADLSLNNRDTVLGIAAGGTTPYVLGGLQYGDDAGAMTALLTCNTVQNNSHRLDLDHYLVLETCPEVLTGSTRLKAGSATKLALNIITTTLFTQLGKVYSNLMVDLRATNDKLTDRAIRILCELCPELTREDAATQLQQTDGDLKSAIIVKRLNVTPRQAKDLLERFDGRLRAILDD